MKLNYKTYEINKNLQSQYSIEFTEKNKYKLIPLYNRSSKVDMYWYTIYDLSEMSYTKFEKKNNVFIKSGKISLGRWSSSLGEKLYTKISDIQFLGYQGVNYGYQTGIESNITYEVISFRLPEINNFLDEKFIKYLPISTYKLATREDSFFPLVGKIKYRNPFEFLNFELCSIE